MGYNYRIDANGIYLNNDKTNRINIENIWNKYCLEPNSLTEIEKVVGNSLKDYMLKKLGD